MPLKLTANQVKELMWPPLIGVIRAIILFAFVFLYLAELSPEDIASVFYYLSGALIIRALTDMGLAPVLINIKSSDRCKSLIGLVVLPQLVFVVLISLAYIGFAQLLLMQTQDYLNWMLFGIFSGLSYLASVQVLLSVRQGTLSEYSNMAVLVSAVSTIAASTYILTTNDPMGVFYREIIDLVLRVTLSEKVELSSVSQVIKKINVVKLIMYRCIRVLKGRAAYESAHLAERTIFSLAMPVMAAVYLAFSTIMNAPNNNYRAITMMVAINQYRQGRYSIYKSWIISTLIIGVAFYSLVGIFVYKGGLNILPIYLEYEALLVAMIPWGMYRLTQGLLIPQCIIVNNYRALVLSAIAGLIPLILLLVLGLSIIHVTSMLGLVACYNLYLTKWSRSGYA